MRHFGDYEHFQSKLIPFNQLNMIDGILSPPPADVIRLCVSRRDVAEWNKKCIDKLPGPEQKYSAIIVGDLNSEDYPAPKELRLKPGMRVMLRFNLYDEEGKLVACNGDSGKIETLAEECVKVHFERIQQSRTIFPHTWQLFNYTVEFDSQEGKYRLKAVELDSFRQIPLIPAYALTVHRAQGLSLPAMQFDRGKGCFEYGQLYTALSRCSSSSQLYLASPVSGRDIKFNPKLARFCEEVELEPDLLLTAMLKYPTVKRWTQPKLISFLREALRTYQVDLLNPPEPKKFESISPEERTADARVFYTLCYKYQPDQKDTVLALLRKYRAAQAQKREAP